MPCTCLWNRGWICLLQCLSLHLGVSTSIGGTIQAVYPFDDPVALVCNDEGKLLGLPWNRALTDDHGVPYDIVCGTFFVAGLKEDDFASLTEQQIEKYKDKYSNEMILSVPKQPEAHKKPMKKEKHEYER